MDAVSEGALDVVEGVGASRRVEVAGGSEVAVAGRVEARRGAIVARLGLGAASWALLAAELGVPAARVKADLVALGRAGWVELSGRLVRDHGGSRAVAEWRTVGAVGVGVGGLTGRVLAEVAAGSGVSAGEVARVVGTTRRGAFKVLVAHERERAGRVRVERCGERPVARGRSEVLWRVAQGESEPAQYLELGAASPAAPGEEAAARPALGGDVVDAGRAGEGGLRGEVAAASVPGGVADELLERGAEVGRAAAAAVQEEERDAGSAEAAELSKAIIEFGEVYEQTLAAVRADDAEQLAALAGALEQGEKVETFTVERDDPWRAYADGPEGARAARFIAGGDAEPPACRYCGADCSDGRSYDGGGLCACPECADLRALGYDTRWLETEEGRATIVGAPDSIQRQRWILGLHAEAPVDEIDRAWAAREASAAAPTVLEGPVIGTPVPDEVLAAANEPRAATAAEPGAPLDVSAYLELLASVAERLAGKGLAPPHIFDRYERALGLQLPRQPDQGEECGLCGAPSGEPCPFDCPARS